MKLSNNNISLYILFQYNRVKCEPGYTGKFCNTRKCVPQDDNNGHYNCSKDGMKICLQGWLDETTNCTTSKYTNR